LAEGESVSDKAAATTQVSSKTERDRSTSDWVTQRFACSLPAVFKNLRLQIEEDVKTRNGLRPENAPYEFFVRDKQDGFVVEVHAGDTSKAVTFRQAQHAILVGDVVGNAMFEITLSFSDQGHCQLIVNKQVLEDWQVRRLALEELLFAGN
jgi:hypothetical protein